MEILSNQSHMVAVSNRSKAMWSLPDSAIVI